MPYEMVIGLDVSDEATYAEYRKAMSPILTSYGGGFRYDFKVTLTLKSESENPINRVFTIHFRDEESMKRFFSDPRYLDVKARYFQSSVNHTTIISVYNR